MEGKSLSCVVTSELLSRRPLYIGFKIGGNGCRAEIVAAIFGHCFLSMDYWGRRKGVVVK